MAIVEAVAISANAGGPGSKFSRKQGQIIQAAMAAAVRDCYRRGVTEPAAVRAAMHDAREKMKAYIKSQGG